LPHASPGKIGRLGEGEIGGKSKTQLISRRPGMRIIRSALSLRMSGKSVFLFQKTGFLKTPLLIRFPI